MKKSNTYNYYRSRIKSGDLLAWTHRGWRSWHDIEVQAVRIFTRSEYCHTAVAWTIGGRVLVLEATVSGVRIFPLSRLLPCYWLKFGNWNLVAEKRALEEVGKPYSRWQAILAGVGLLKAGEDGVWQCAEYALTVLNAARTELVCSSVTPSAVVQAALEYGSKLVYLTGDVQ